MPSPFPGMDPYLETVELWPAFHHQLVTCLYQILLPSIAGRYKLHVGQRRYAPAPSAPEAQEEYIEIHQCNEPSVVTLVDVVTPANKTTAAGRQAYLDKRREGRTVGANLVLIDLVRQGQPLLEYSREGLSEWDYDVTVTRANQSERHEIYTSTLRRRLPRFRMPLASDDRDTVVDLQTALNRSYEQGGFAQRINYERDPPVAVKDEDRGWLYEHLRQHGLRPADLTHDEIAVASYFLWQQEGCPPGRDQEFWLRAKERLTRGRDGR